MLLQTRHLGRLWLSLLHFLFLLAGIGGIKDVILVFLCRLSNTHVIIVFIRGRRRRCVITRVKSRYTPCTLYSLRFTTSLFGRHDFLLIILFHICYNN